MTFASQIPNFEHSIVYKYFKSEVKTRLEFSDICFKDSQTLFCMNWESTCQAGPYFLAIT